MRLVIRVVSFILLFEWSLVSLVVSAGASSKPKTSGGEESGGADSAPPPFFLQDTSDSLCLAGGTFKRCSINTLFYVVGKPGSYQIHKRPANGIIPDDDDETKVCIAKRSCKDSDYDKIESVILTKCSHCGAKRWNVLGDGDTGYVLTEGGDEEEGSDGAKAKKTCLFRKDNMAMTAPCDSDQVQYTPLQLRFASAHDIKTMDSPGAKMISAASDGDLVGIQKLIKDEKIDINVRDWDQLTALIPASSAGHIEVCKYLIDNGIDVNAADKDGITALMEASIMGHADVVKLLIDSGATVDLAATSEVSALWLAASEGQVECMKVLLDKEASASNTRVDGISALMTAAIGGHADAIKLLIEHGADPAATDKEGLTPLMNAAENGTVAVLQVLAEATKNDPSYINAVSNNGFNSLIIASAHGHASAVDFLLSAGAEIDAAAVENKVSPLMFAVASNHVDAARVLIEKGCDIDAKHSNGGTALLEAATSGSVDAMKLLIEKGATVDILDDDGVTPLMAIASNGNVTGLDVLVEALQKKFDNDETKLKDFINLHSKSGGSTVMFATAGGHAEATKKLIALGADIHAIARATPDYLVKLQEMKAEGISQEADEHIDGVTALHVAAQGGHLEVVQILIDAGVDVTIKDDDGRTALSLALKGNYGEVASALVKAGADPNTQYIDEEKKEHNLLFDSIMVENVEFAVLLIEKGADLYYQDDKKVSTLLQASHRGLAEVTKALLEKHKANTNGKATYLDDPSDEGITPLIAASSGGHVEVVKVLIEHKANLDSVDQDLTTALMAASARGHSKVVKELLEAGAKVNSQNSDGHTALMFAYNGKNQVETLWERFSEYIKEEKEANEKYDEGDTGTVIRDALDSHLELVDLLYKFGADATIKDKEGHTAKDFDYNPDLDEKVIAKQAKTEKIKDESKYEL